MHAKSYSAAFPLILSEDKTKILLHLRQNTGYMDGYWDTAGGGHVDALESATAAAVRECKEEVGIYVEAKDLNFVHLTHHYDQDEAFNYYHLYFEVLSFQGIPQIMEPHKMADLKWVPLNDLPDNLIPVRKLALSRWLDGITYTETYQLSK